MHQFDQFPDLTNRRKKAIDHCVQHMKWYQAHASRAAFFYRFFQTSAIVFGALTPILILWSSIPQPLQALPAALAAIATGLVASFQWQQNWLRFAATSEALKSKLIKFETRTSPAYQPEGNDHLAIDHFVQAVHTLVLEETSRWLPQLLKKPAHPSSHKKERRHPVPTASISTTATHTALLLSHPLATALTQKSHDTMPYPLLPPPLYHSTPSPDPPAHLPFFPHLHSSLSLPAFLPAH